MILATTPTLGGREITGHLGIVSGRHSHGTNMIEHLLERIRGIFGGRAELTEKQVAATEAHAKAAMIAAAEALGADAVIGISTSYAMMGGGRIVQVNMVGSAVRLAPEAEV